MRFDDRWRARNPLDRSPSHERALCSDDAAGLADPGNTLFRHQIVGYPRLARPGQATALRLVAKAPVFSVETALRNHQTEKSGTNKAPNRLFRVSPLADPSPIRQRRPRKPGPFAALWESYNIFLYQSLKVGGGRSLLRTLLYRNSLITPDLPGKGQKNREKTPARWIFPHTFNHLRENSLRNGTGNSRQRTGNENTGTGNTSPGSGNRPLLRPRDRDLPPTEWSTAQVRVWRGLR